MLALLAGNCLAVTAGRITAADPPWLAVSDNARFLVAADKDGPPGGS